jgi:hypothetical protein
MQAAMTWRKWTAALVAGSSMALFGGKAALAHDAPLAQTERAPAIAQSETLTGTVRELVVDDTVHGSSARYVEMELDDGSLVALDNGAATALAAGARVKVTGHVEGRAVQVEAAQTLDAAVPSAKADAEVEGTLAVLHADDFARGRSEFVYEIHQANGRVRRLRLARLPAELKPGAKLRVVGRIEADGASITPSRITILAAPATTSSTTGAVAKAATASSVLVIMANFSNTATPAYSSAQAQQVMTSNADSVANFFREVSYGQQLLNVTVTPAWVTMNLAQPATCNSSDWQAIGSGADAAARTLGTTYDPSAYNYVVYLFPNVPACGWIGLAYIGSPHRAWINGVGGFKTSAIAHEMGHNFGLLHAASVRCSSGSIGGSCSVSEYGDPFDTMGNQRAMHYNATQKARLAWIPSGSVKTHTGGAATYTLSPLEVAGGATYAVKIPTGSANRTYWLEYRQPIGFDSPLSAYPNNGAQIRVASPFETLCSGCDSWSDDTQLLDMTMGTSAFTDAALVSGQTFSDATYGINVTVVSASASALTVQVSIGGAPPPIAATSTALTASPNPSVVGTAVTFTASVSGSAPGGTVGFSDNGAAIAGCSALALAGSGNTRTATCVAASLTAGAHTIVAAYSGDALNTASSATLAQTVGGLVNGTNVAAASNGGVASASSVYSPGYAVDGVNDERRSGANWGAGGGWNDGTGWSLPDWVQVRFNGPKTIDHVVVYSVQDNFLNPVEPTDSMVFSLYGLTSFQVQGWTGSSWITLGTVSGNNLVKRTVTFAPYTTDRIRIYVTGTKDGQWSRITEIEAWTPTVLPAQTNYALASNGASAAASSTHSSGYAVSGVIDNKRSGAQWGSGGGWNDGTSFAFPDWVQVDFSGVKTIDHIVVYSVQDNFLNPTEPTDAMTFTLYGLTSFEVQGWNGSTWTPLGSVTGNRFIKRTVSFAAFTTSRIRVVVSGAADGKWSRITEVEAWGN